MFKQQIDALQMILDKFTLPNNADISDENLIKEKDEEELIETLSGIINDIIIKHIFFKILNNNSSEII